MKLPDGDQAIIELRKLTEYCLNWDHEDGRHKAALFDRRLGITVQNADILLAALRQAAADGEAVPGRSDQYGHRYVVDFECEGPGGIAAIRSVWIVRAVETAPRLVTCYIL